MNLGGVAQAVETGSTPATAAGAAVQLRVREVVVETPEASSLVFDVPAEHAQAFAYVPGQYVELEIPFEGMRLRRCYSLSSTPGLDAQPKVTIKRVAGGRVSNWLLDNVSAGDTVACVPPAGDFVREAASTERALLAFAAGSGITPVLSLVRAALRHSQSAVRLVYANQNKEAEIFAAQLADLSEAYPKRFELVEHFDDARGLLTAEQVQHHTQAFEALAEADVFLCGPAPFMSMVEGALEAAGVGRNHIKIERFISRIDPDRQAQADQTGEAAEPTAAPKSLSVTLKGKRYHLDYVAGDSVLATCKRHGVDAPRSCEDGYCGSCMAVLKYGDPSLGNPQALSEADIDKGRVLTCQLRPASAAPFGVTYDEASFRRNGPGELGSDAPRISRWRAVAVILLLAGASIGLRLLRSNL